MLVAAMMSMMLMTALGTALVLTTMTEVTVAGNYRRGTEAFYAAEAAVEWVIQDLAAVPDWSVVATSNPYVDARLADMLLPATIASAMQVVVEVARPPEADDDAGDGLEVLIIAGRARGPDGSSRAIEVTVVREGSGAENPRPIRVLFWRELT